MFFLAPPLPLPAPRRDLQMFTPEFDVLLVSLSLSPVVKSLFVAELVGQ